MEYPKIWEAIACIIFDNDGTMEPSTTDHYYKLLLEDKSDSAVVTSLPEDEDELALLTQDQLEAITMGCRMEDEPPTFEVDGTTNVVISKTLDAVLERAFEIFCEGA